MTEPQLRAKIEYCVALRAKYDRLEDYFNSKLEELQEDFHRMTGRKANIYKHIEVCHFD